MEEILKSLKKFWKFVWYGNSILSWITAFVLIFIIVKFIFFPTLALVTGASMPIVVIESCSLYHSTTDLDDWWEKKGAWYDEKDITKEQFSEFNFKKGMNKGDIILLIKKKEYNLGEVIIFNPNQESSKDTPIIHRIISLDPYATKGDNNNNQFTPSNNALNLDETNIGSEQIIGKSVIRIPFVGWAKLIFYEPFRTESEQGFCE